MDIPPGMKSGIICNVLPDNKIQLVLVKDAKPVDLIIPPEGVATVAAELLQAAKIAHDRSGVTLPSGRIWPSIIPSKVALGPSNVANHECLIVSCGRAEIGFSLATEILQPLGQSLITLGASGKRN